MVVVPATAMCHQTFQLWRFERRNRTSSLDVPSQGNSLVRERWAKSARTGPVFTRWNHSRGDIPAPSDLSYTPTSPPATTFFHYSLGPSVFSIPAFFTRQLLRNLWIRGSSSLAPSRPKIVLTLAESPGACGVSWEVEERVRGSRSCWGRIR